MDHKPKWVIFDVGNVLFSIDRFILDVAEKYKFDHNDLLTQIDTVDEESGFDGSLTISDFWKNVLLGFNATHVLDNVMDMWHAGSYWQQDTKKLMVQLQNAGYKLAVITNNWKDQTEHLRENLSDFVNHEYIFESSVEKLSKPNEKLFVLVENRIGAKGSEILFIDDIKSYLQGAQKRHWQTFLYTIGTDSGKTSNDRLRKLLLH